MGSLTALNWLWLNHTQLTGPIPSALGSLSSLTVLNLNHTQLTGPIPSALGSLANLRSFYATGNAGTFCLPLTLRTWYNACTNRHTVTLCGTTAPNRPTVSVPADQLGSLAVSWSAPTNTDLTINGYDIESSADEGTPWTRVLLPSVTTTTLTGLVDGRAYIVRVWAVGESPDNPNADPYALATFWSPASAPQTPLSAFGGRTISNKT